MSPFANFKDWDDCIAKTRKKHPDWSAERCDRYCGAIKHRTEGEGDTPNDSRRQPKRR